jgi:hypothetical protein
MGFEASLRLNVAKMQQDIDQKISFIAEDLFTTIIGLTPVSGENIAPKNDHPGLIKNNWYASKNGFDLSFDRPENPSGADSLSSVKALYATGTFLGVDGSVSMCNSAPYVRNVEYDGWTRTRPYAMVANGFTESLGAKLK